MSRVYVGRVPSRCNERELEKYFREYGKIRDVVLKNGYGFVEFDHYKDADEAVYRLNSREFRGEKLIVEHAKPPSSRDRRDGFRGYGGYGGGRRMYRESRYGPPTRTEYRAIVENLSSRISWQDLKDTMRKAGEVCYADAHRQVKNEGIVEFQSREDLKAAIEKFNGYELNGRKIRVYEDKVSRRRSSSRSSHGSRRKRSKRSHSSRSGSPRRSRSKRSVSRSVSRRSDSKRSASRSPKRSRSVSHRSTSRNGKYDDQPSGRRSYSRSRSRSDHSRSRSRTRSEKSRSRSPVVKRSASRSPRGRSVSRGSESDRD